MRESGWEESQGISEFGERGEGASSDAPASRISSCCSFLIVGGVCAALHFLWDFPTLSHPATLLRGWPGDNFIFVWDLWWVSTSIWELPGASTFHCPMLLSPEGFCFAFHTHTYLYGLIYAILQIPWRLVPGLGLPPSPILAYNLFCLSSTVLTGLGAAVLCRDHGIRSTLGMTLGAVTVAFCGLRLFSLYGHLNLVGTEFLVWSVVFHSRASFAPPEGRAGRWWFLGGVLWGLAALNELTYGAFAGMFWFYCVVWKTASSWARRDGIVRSLLRGPALSLLPFLVVTAFYLSRLVAVFLSPDYTVGSLYQSRICDVLNLFIPSDYSAIWRPATIRLRGVLEIGGAEGVAFLGWASFWTLGWAVARMRKERARLRDLGGRTWFWIGLALFGLLIAPGEWFSLCGVRIVPMPYRLSRWIPVVNNLRIPERYTVFILIPAALLAAGVVGDLIRRASRKRLALFLAGWTALFLAGAVHRFDIRLDSRRYPAALPDEAVERLAPARLATTTPSVWVIPSSFCDTAPLLWQTRIRRPFVFAHVARVPSPSVAARVDRYPFVRGILLENEPSVRHAIEAAGSVGEMRRQIASFADDFQVGFIVVRKDVWSEGEAFVAENLPGVRLIHDDGNVAVFEISSGSPKGNFSHEIQP